MMNKITYSLATVVAASLCSVAMSAPIVVDIAGSGVASNLQGTTADGTRTIRYNAIGANSSVGNMTDINGNRTGIAITWVAGKASANNSVAAGYFTGPATTIFPDGAARSFIGSTTPKNNFMRWRFDGLDLGASYDFAFLSAREGTGNATTVFTVLGANTVSGSINAKGNTGTLLNVAGALPDQYGSLELVVTFASSNTGTFTYFNALQMTEVPAVSGSASAVPEPGSLGLLLLSGLLVARRSRKPAGATRR